jgi:uncharacterized membrane protein YtjA (UPF0391 family)
VANELMQRLGRQVRHDAREMRRVERARESVVDGVRGQQECTVSTDPFGPEDGQCATTPAVGDAKFQANANGTVSALLKSSDNRLGTECSSQEGIVLYYALVFLVVALIAGALGVSGVSAVATNIAYVLFVVAIVMFVVHLVSGRRTLTP